MKKITPFFILSILSLFSFISKAQTNDAAVLSLDSPYAFCAGTEDIYVKIGNMGTNRIDSVEIHWEFNGIPQNSVKHTQLLDTLNGLNPNTAVVLLGSKTFASADPDTIKIWVSNPNSALDTVNSNDTISAVLQAALSGNYSINPSLAASSTNYQSFSELAYDLNNYGICGPTNISVAAGTYNEFFHLNEIPGSSQINSLSIEGQDSSNTILSHDASTSFATLTLNGTDYLTIKNLGIEASGSTGAVIIFANGAEKNTISNSELTANVSSNSSNLYNVLFSGSTTGYSTGAIADYNTISNNRLTGGYYGIRLYGSASNLNVNNRILYNEISEVYYYGVYGHSQDSLEIIGNNIEVNGRGNASSVGAYLYYSSNSKINENYIQASKYGVYYYNYNTYAQIERQIDIINNMIITDTDEGMVLYYVDSVAVIHNSISANGGLPALLIYSSSARPIRGYDLRNNVFSSKYGRAVSTNVTDLIFDYLDNNLYYTKGNNLLTINSTDYPTLADYQSISPQFNTASLVGDPQFFSPSSDLHIAGAWFDDSGDNSVNISTDIDGDPRPMTASSFVDIGADEYNAASCPPLYDLSAYDPHLDSISLQWAGGSGTLYEIEVVLLDSMQGSGDTLYSSTNSIRIGNLTSATGYEYYVRQICVRGDTSIWSGPFEFYTAYPLSFFEDFESFTGGGLNNGWFSTTHVDPLWKSGTSTYYGPKQDHTIGAGGTFAYLTTDLIFMKHGGLSSPSLVSPPIYVDSNSHMEISFWYHMSYSDTAGMNVYIDSNGVSNLITTISGQQQLNSADPWLNFSTYLKGYENKIVRLRFAGNKIEMAIDDVSLSTVPLFDAGVVELQSPQGRICAGNYTPVVGVRNLGSTDIDSVKVLWEVNGSLLDSVMYATKILPGDTAAVSLKNINFNSSTIYDLKIYTRNPNSTVDPITSDDTLKLNGIRTGLAGNYTIDPSSPASMSNFVDFTSAAKALNEHGVCGPTTFTVAYGTYNESVTLMEIDGASSVNSITFDGVDSSATTITHDGSSSFATWTFEGADYVSLQNMRIEASGTSKGASVLFKDADHNKVINCELSVDINSISSAVSNVIFSGNTSAISPASASNSNYNLIENNKISGGYYGIYLYGSSQDVDVNNKIYNNEINDVRYYGVYSIYQDSTEIIGNKIDVASRGYASSIGIHNFYSNNTLIHKNYVHANDYGIYFYNYSTYAPANRTIAITNNMVISETDNSMYLYYVETVDILHNSFLTHGSNPAVQINSGTRVHLTKYDVRNNIFSAKGGAAFSTNEPDTMFALFDYNAFYTKGSPLLTINSVDYADLPSYIAVAPQFNTFSIVGDPQFNSATDLHIVGTFVNDKGDNSTGITTDFDGETRPIAAGPVDIGADEFNPPSCPPVLNLQAFNPSPDSITLQWEGGFGKFEYEIVLRDSLQATGIIDTSYTDSIRVGELFPNTAYDYYVREICGKGDTSIWWGPISFETTEKAYDLELRAIITPSNTQACYTSAEDIELLLVNAGAAAIDFSVDTSYVNVEVSGAANSSFSFELNNNSLNPNTLPLQTGDSIVIYMGQLDLTNIGSYNFMANITLETDTNLNNDSLRATVVNATSGGNLSGPNYVCGSDTVLLTTNTAVGEIQWQRLVNGIFTNEIGANSTSLEIFIDSTTVFRVVACGTEYSDTITVSASAIPNVPTVISDTAIVFCGDSATAVLSASSSVGGVDFYWYNDSNATAPIASGSTYNFGLNTSTQSATTEYTDTFYVSVVDTISSCESELAMVSGTVICTVGEEEMPSAKMEFSIFPNPSEAVFNLTGTNLMEEIQISVFNSTGTLIYELDPINTANFNERIDLSNMANGMYFIKLQGPNTFEMRKIILR